MKTVFFVKMVRNEMRCIAQLYISKFKTVNQCGKNIYKSREYIKHLRMDSYKRERNGHVRRMKENIIIASKGKDRILFCRTE